jgi:hypothetical protein
VTLTVTQTLVIVACAATLPRCALPPPGLKGDTFEPTEAKECSTAELIARAKNPDWGRAVRIAAISELSERTGEADQVVPALVALVQDPATEARIHIVTISMLGDMGPSARQAVPALIDQIPSAIEKPAPPKDGEYVASVPGALKRITGMDFGDDQERWQRWAELPVGRTAAQTAPSSAALEQACDAGDLKACENGGDAGACYNLGVCYVAGECGLAEDVTRAGPLFRKGCDAGLLPSCTNLGVCYAEGDCGFPKDELQASRLFEKACDDGGDDAGCANLHTDRGEAVRRVVAYARGVLFWS